MIYDTLENLGTYTGMPLVPEIVAFLSSHDLTRLESGAHPIRGGDLVLKKSGYTLNAVTSRFEAHRQFADVHMVLSGSEVIRTAFPSSSFVASPYDPSEDVEFFSGDAECTEFVLRPGRFLYLAPGEIHRPMCAAPGYAGIVSKCVFKVRWPGR